MKRPDPSLVAYIEAEIIPRYEHFDRAHGTDHVRTVIAQSLALAARYDVDTDMVYTVAAYHDTGLANGRERHHIDAGRILAEDAELRRRFTEEQIGIMREAVEDHRASSDHPPRTIYGRIVAEADRVIDPATIVRRTVQYGLANYPALDREGHYARFWPTCKRNMPKEVTCASGSRNRTMPGGSKSSGRSSATRSGCGGSSTKHSMRKRPPNNGKPRSFRQVPGTLISSL